MLRVLAVCLTISWSLCMTEGVRAVGELNESLQKVQNDVNKDVIKSCTKLSQGKLLLYEAPQTVYLMDCIAVISASVEDATLPRPENGFKHLKYPYFRVCLEQVTTSMTNSFRNAHSAMSTIEQSLIDLPEVLMTVIEETTKNPNSTRIKKYNEQLMRRISNSATTCSETAKNIVTEFFTVLEEIDELKLATTAANAQNRNHSGWLERENKALEEERKAAEENFKLAEKRYKQLLEEKKKAIENFEKQSDRATDFATVVDTSFLKIVSEQKQFKELIEGRTALGELVGKMESMDLEQVDLNEVIEVLGDAMEYLQKVRRQWNDLVQFFDEIKKIIDQNIIADNLKPTLRLVSYCIQVDSQIDPVILKSTLRLVAYCIQVGNSARLYQIVSEKHITSKLRYVADRLTLDKVKAKQRKARFKHKFQELTNDVTKLVDDESAKLDYEYKTKMSKYLSQLEQHNNSRLVAAEAAQQQLTQLSTRNTSCQNCLD